MKCIRHGPVGAGGCMKGAVTQGSCSRKATRTRDTGRVLIRLCDKCDAAFGRVLGKEVVGKNPGGYVDARPPKMNPGKKSAGCHAETIRGHQVEVVKASTVYGNKAGGWVVLVDGHIYLHGDKTDAERMVEKFRSLKTNPDAAWHRSRKLTYAALGDKSAGKNKAYYDGARDAEDGDLYEEETRTLMTRLRNPIYMPGAPEVESMEVVYKSRPWQALTENGWVTKEVRGTKAIMLPPRGNPGIGPVDNTSRAGDAKRRKPEALSLGLGDPGAEELFSKLLKLSEQEQEKTAGSLVETLPKQIIDRVIGGSYVETNMQALYTLLKDPEARELLVKAAKKNPGIRYHQASAQDMAGVAGKYEKGSWDQAFYRGAAAAHEGSARDARFFRRQAKVRSQQRTIEEVGARIRATRGEKNPGDPAQADIEKIKGFKPEMLQHPDFMPALKKYLEFHGCMPESLTKVNINLGKEAKGTTFLAHMGKAPEVSYQTTNPKSNKAGSRWIHEFCEDMKKKDIKQNDLPDLACTADGKAIITVGGRFEVKDWVRK